MQFIIPTFAEDFISENEIQNSILSQPKCKFYWKIDTVEQVPNQNDPLNCYGIFRITANWVSMQWSNQYGDCVGMSTVFPIYDPNIGSYYPAVWENIYVVLNSSSNEILQYWKNLFDKYPELPLCEWWESVTWPDSWTQYIDPVTAGTYYENENISIENPVIEKIENNTSLIFISWCTLWIIIWVFFYKFFVSKK